MTVDEQSLASWNDTPTRQAIVDFVDTVTTEGNAGFVPPEERIATFDNDGTLWAEKPIPIQLDFTLRRFAALAEADPQLRDQQPYKAAYEHDMGWLGASMVKHYHGDDSDLGLLMAASSKAFADLTVEAYSEHVAEFFRTADHPTLAPSVSDVWLPADGRTAAVPRGQRLRPLHRVRRRPRLHAPGRRRSLRHSTERVIGSSLEIGYVESDDDARDVLYKAQMDFFDDGPTKPVRIWSRIGRRPVLACGNSNGDIEMLRFAKTDKRPALRLLVLHDDAEREFDYTAGAEKALERAGQAGWTVISIKDDWAKVFAD